MDDLGNVQMRFTNPKTRGGAYGVSITGYRDGQPRRGFGASPDFMQAYWMAIAAYLDVPVEDVQPEANFPE